MEMSAIEAAAVEKVSPKAPELQMHDLGVLELALVGGGTGDIILG